MPNNSHPNPQYPNSPSATEILSGWVPHPFGIIERVGSDFQAEHKLKTITGIGVPHLRDSTIVAKVGFRH